MQELTQEQLLNHGDAAIHLLESETGHVATTQEIQAYLRTMGYDEPLERIKWATDELASIEEAQELELPEGAQE